MELHVARGRCSAGRSAGRTPPSVPPMGLARNDIVVSHVQKKSVLYMAHAQWKRLLLTSDDISVIAINSPFSKGERDSDSTHLWRRSGKAKIDNK